MASYGLHEEKALQYSVTDVFVKRMMTVMITKQPVNTKGSNTLPL